MLGQPGLGPYPLCSSELCDLEQVLDFPGPWFPHLLSGKSNSYFASVEMV